MLTICEDSPNGRVDEPDQQYSTCDKVILNYKFGIAVAFAPRITLTYSVTGTYIPHFFGVKIACEPKMKTGICDNIPCRDSGLIHSVGFNTQHNEEDEHLAMRQKLLNSS